MTKKEPKESRQPAGKEPAPPASVPGQAGEKKQRVDKVSIHIYSKWCKHCGICVAFCPMGVFITGKDGMPIIAHPEKCTHCGICAMLCPDFAISGVEEVIKHPIDLSEFISP